MQVIKGSKREVSIFLHQEQLEKYMKRLNDSMECFRRFHEASDLEHMQEDIEKLQETVSLAHKSIEYMDYHGIE